MTRDEHLEWCKRRAHEDINRGAIAEGLGQMFRDLRNHPELADHPAIELGLALMVAGHLHTQAAARKFVEGFN